VCRETGKHGFGREGWNSNVPLDPLNGTQCKVLCEQCSKPLIFRSLLIVLILSKLESSTKNNHKRKILMY
jgi:hypothetical protein